MTKPKKIGFAVVGLGTIAQSAVLPCFARSRKSKLVALVSRDKKKAVQLARKFKARFAYSQDEYSACLANPEVSAIYIATPPGEHAAFTIEAARAGKHVLCEKPLAATVEQSAAMVEACRQNGVLLMTAYRKYFEAGSLQLKNLIRRGDLGRIDVIHTAFSELHSPKVSQAWLLDSKAAGGGPLTDLGVYCVNTTRWLVDEDPVEASAQSWVNDPVRFTDVEEGISFRLRFPSGLVVLGSSSYGASPSSFVVVHGTKGFVSFSPAFPWEVERRLTGNIGKRRIDRKFKLVDEFALEVDAFASAIQSNRPVESDGAQGHRDMIIIRAIYESARKKQPVVIRY